MLDSWRNFKERERARYAAKVAEADRRGPPRAGISPLGVIVLVAVGVFLALWLFNAAASA